MSTRRPDVQSRRRRWNAIPLCIISIAFVLAFGAGCGSDGPSHAADAGVVVPFFPDASPLGFDDVPWPSDLHRGTDGFVVPPPGLERLVARPERLHRELVALDGFGRSTGALFFVDQALDPATLPTTWEEATAADAGVLLVDVDPQSTRFGERYPALAKYLPGFGCVSVIPVPGVVLPPGVRHAAVLTRQVRTAEGRPLVAAPELKRILDLPRRQRTLAAEQLYGDAGESLVTRRVVGRNEIAALAVFTTSDRVLEMAALRDRLHREPAPQLLIGSDAAAPYTSAIFAHAGTPSLGDWLGTPERDDRGRDWPGGDNPGGMPHDAIGVVASGTFIAPSFLRRGGGFAVDSGSGAAHLTEPDAKVPVTIVLPREPPPPAGYPVVVHGHGLSNHRGSMFGVANELARAGFAMVGIDDVLHGARQGIVDVMNNYPGPYQGPDGIPDGVGFPITFFAGFGDFVAIRDNFRQTVLDHVSLVRLIQNPELDLSLLATEEVVSPHLDPDRIYWSGGSLGGIVGTMVLAVEPEIRAGALQVPGASFLQLITTQSAELAPLVATLTRVLFSIDDIEAIDPFHPVATLLASVTEPGDPIAYAPHVIDDPIVSGRAPADVLVTYALHDEVLPNVATEALIRALGLELAEPRLVDVPGVRTVVSPVQGNLPSGRTGAAVQYAPANHGLGYGRFDLRRFLPSEGVDGADRPRLAREFRFEMALREHLDQKVGFFLSLAAGGPGRIEVTAPPVADYDGDGVLDDDEVRAGTDPHDPESS